MACRKVVIGPRLSGIAEILRDGENGFMFTADDGEDFKRLIRELIRNRGRLDTQSASGRTGTSLRSIPLQAAAKQYAEALEHFAAL